MFCFDYFIIGFEGLIGWGDFGLIFRVVWVVCGWLVGCVCCLFEFVIVL